MQHFCFCTIQYKYNGTVDYASKVNTLIGSEGKGHGVHERYLEAGYTFPGAMYPFGMVQFTPTFFNQHNLHNDWERLFL